MFRPLQQLIGSILGFSLLMQGLLGFAFPVLAQEFELLPFKQALDRANMTLVLGWLVNDLKHSELKPLAEELEQQKGILLETLPAVMGPLNYEALIVAALSETPEQEAELRRLIRYSVAYLNLDSSQEISALTRVEPAAPIVPENHFEQRSGYPDELLELQPETPHTLVHLQDYNRRRLGQVPLEYALLGDWPVYLYDCDGTAALNHLKTEGFTDFYQLNAFYSRWGKEVYLARRGSQIALVYADIYGTWMEAHLLYMLRTTEHQGRRLNPEKVQRLHIQGPSSKDRFLAAYRKDLKAIKQENTLLVLGYFGLLGDEIQSLYTQTQQGDWLRAHLDANQIQYQMRHSSPQQGSQLERHVQAGLPVQVLPDVSAALQAACPQCPLQQAFKQLTFAQVGQRQTGEALLSEAFQWRDAKGKIWQVLNLGANHSLYGDMTRDLVAIALELGIREIVFAGSAGAIRTDLPVYSWVFPTEFRDFQGQKLATPNAFSYGLFQPEAVSKPYLTYGTIHQGVRSPVAETQALIRRLQSENVATLDVEVAEIARAIQQYPGAHFSAALLVTDYPGAFLNKQDVHLDQVNYSQKYQYLPALVRILSQNYQLEEILPHD